LRGGSPYRAKAYARAADNLLALSIPIDQLIAEELQEIPASARLSPASSNASSRREPIPRFTVKRKRVAYM
jgi:hypothetical protein